MILTKILEQVGSVFKSAPQDTMTPFVLFRDKEDKLRFVAVYSNIFEDKHTEILTTESHKEYVSWVDRTKLYPELHIWHCGDGSKIGQVDLIDFVDGFCVASGYIDAAKEDIAHKAAANDPGVSHGFVGLLDNSNGQWDRYRSFELSVLPAWAAGNEALDALYAPGKKEFFMAFAPEKRAYLEGLGLAKEDIDSWENSLKARADQLKKAGINHKSQLEDDKPADDKPQPQPQPQPSPQPQPKPDENEGQRQQTGQQGSSSPGVTTHEPTREAATKSELAFFAKAHADSNEALTQVVGTLGTLTETVKALSATVEQLKKPADQRSAEEWQSLVSATPGGFVATQAKSNTTDEKDDKEADDFFGNIVMAQVSKTLGIGGS